MALRPADFNSDFWGFGKAPHVDESCHISLLSTALSADRLVAHSCRKMHRIEVQSGSKTCTVDGPNLRPTNPLDC
jgi:hypothetical protein